MTGLSLNPSCSEDEQLLTAVRDAADSSSTAGGFDSGYAPPPPDPPVGYSSANETTHDSFPRGNESCFTAHCVTDCSIDNALPMNSSSRDPSARNPSAVAAAGATKRSSARREDGRVVGPAEGCTLLDPVVKPSTAEATNYPCTRIGSVPHSVENSVTGPFTNRSVGCTLRDSAVDSSPVTLAALSNIAAELRDAIISPVTATMMVGSGSGSDSGIDCGKIETGARGAFTPDPAFFWGGHHSLSISQSGSGSDVVEEEQEDHEHGRECRQEPSSGDSDGGGDGEKSRPDIIEKQGFEEDGSGGGCDNNKGNKRIMTFHSTPAAAVVGITVSHAAVGSKSCSPAVPLLLSDADKKKNSMLLKVSAPLPAPVLPAPAFAPATAGRVIGCSPGGSADIHNSATIVSPSPSRNQRRLPMPKEEPENVESLSGIRKTRSGSRSARIYIGRDDGVRSRKSLPTAVAVVGNTRGNDGGSSSSIGSSNTSFVVFDDDETGAAEIRVGASGGDDGSAAATTAAVVALGGLFSVDSEENGGGAAKDTAAAEQAALAALVEAAASIALEEDNKKNRRSGSSSGGGKSGGDGKGSHSSPSSSSPMNTISSRSFCSPPSAQENLHQLSRPISSFSQTAGSMYLPSTSAGVAATTTTTTASLAALQRPHSDSPRSPLAATGGATSRGASRTPVGGKEAAVPDAISNRTSIGGGINGSNSQQEHRPVAGGISTKNSASPSPLPDPASPTSFPRHRPPRSLPIDTDQPPARRVGMETEAGTVTATATETPPSAAATLFSQAPLRLRSRLQPAQTGGGQTPTPASGTGAGTSKRDEKRRKGTAVLRIFDARPMISAKGHLIMGKGHEVISRLGGPRRASLTFLEIPNVHTMQQSFLALSAACCEEEDDPAWLMNLHVSFLFFLNGFLGGVLCSAVRCSVVYWNFFFCDHRSRKIYGGS